MDREKLKNLTRITLGAIAIILLMAALVATAVYQLHRVGVSGTWLAVLGVLSAVLTVVFFALAKDAAYWLTLLAVGASFGPTVYYAIADGKVFNIGVLVILCGVAVVLLAILGAINNRDDIKKGWPVWAVLALFGLMFVVMGVTAEGARTRTAPVIGDVILLGAMAVFSLAIGIVNLRKARKDDDSAYKSAGLVAVIIGSVLLLVTVVVILVAPTDHRQKRGDADVRPAARGAAVTCRFYAADGHCAGPAARHAAAARMRPAPPRPQELAAAVRRFPGLHVDVDVMVRRGAAAALTTGSTRPEYAARAA